MPYLDEIRKELVEFHRLERAKEHLDEIQELLNKKYKKKDILIDLLHEHNASYEDLEGLSLKSVFHKVLGSKEKQMEKERQNYLQLAGEMEELTESIKLLEFEWKVLSARMGNYEKSKKRIHNLKKKREEALIKKGGSGGQLLKNTLAEIDDAHDLHSDIEEALKEGRELATMLKKMVGLLGKTRKWGAYPQGTRPGYHNYVGSIDQARKMSHRVQHQLTKFERELHDVFPYADRTYISFDFERFDNFFLMFFDNLISDWIIQQRIVNTRHQVSSFLDRIQRTLMSLEAEEERVAEKLLAAKALREDILLGKRTG